MLAETRSADRQIPPAAIGLLRAEGADKLAHSGRTLLVHLLGTYEILARWKCPIEVCLAGLFHSVYGTNAFTHATIDLGRREDVEAVIGAAAERLAWLFAMAERPGALCAAVEARDGAGGHLLELRGVSKSSCTIDERTLSNLLHIECANLIEQDVGERALQELYCVAINCENLIVDPALRELERYLATGLAQRRWGEEL